MKLGFKEGDLVVQNPMYYTTPGDEREVYRVIKVAHGNCHLLTISSLRRVIMSNEILLHYIPDAKDKVRFEKFYDENI